jgi:nitroreductase
MDSLEALKTRRSIRKYTNQKISDNDIKELLTCAMYSPSGLDRQPWHFIVIDKKELFIEIFLITSHADMIKEASHAIIICGDKKLEGNQGLLIEDISAATENLLIAAHSLGLGAVWIGIYPFDDIEKGVRKLLKIPDNVLPVSMAVIGYPAEIPEQPDRFKEDRIHFNKW